MFSEEQQTYESSVRFSVSSNNCLQTRRQVQTKIHFGRLQKFRGTFAPFTCLENFSGGDSDTAVRSAVSDFLFGHEQLCLLVFSVSETSRVMNTNKRSRDPVRFVPLTGRPATEPTARYLKITVRK